MYAIICPVTDTVLCTDGRFRSWPLMAAEPKLYKRNGNAVRHAPTYRTPQHREALKNETVTTLSLVWHYESWCKNKQDQNLFQKCGA